MSRLANWFDGKCIYWEHYYRRFLRAFGLSSKDGDLSFSKAFGISVLLSYLVNDNLPASVAITLILSAHGTKVLLEGIRAYRHRKEESPAEDKG